MAVCCDPTCPDPRWSVKAGPDAPTGLHDQAGTPAVGPDDGRNLHRRASSRAVSDFSRRAERCHLHGVRQTSGTLGQSSQRGPPRAALSGGPADGGRDASGSCSFPLHSADDMEHGQEPGCWRRAAARPRGPGFDAGAGARGGERGRDPRTGAADDARGLRGLRRETDRSDDAADRRGRPRNPGHGPPAGGRAGRAPRGRAAGVHHPDRPGGPIGLGSPGAGGRPDDPARCHRRLRRAGPPDRLAGRGPSRRRCGRAQPVRPADPLPPGDRRRRDARGLRWQLVRQPRGAPRAQAGAARRGGRRRPPTLSPGRATEPTSRLCARIGRANRERGPYPPRMIAVLRAYRLLLRNGPLARLLAGEFVSSIGDWLYLVAILILVYEVSKDPLVLGIVGAARVLPYVVLSIPAGILADRYDRRLILLVTDVARGTLMLVMAALVAAHAPVVTIVVLAVVATCFSTFFSPAIGAYLPSLVADEEQLGPANSAWSTLDNLAFVIGPAIAGLLIAAGGLALAFVLNAATFAVIAVVLWRLPSPRRGVIGEVREVGAAGEVREPGEAPAAAAGTAAAAGASPASTPTPGQVDRKALRRVVVPV